MKTENKSEPDTQLSLTNLIRHAISLLRNHFCPLFSRDMVFHLKYVLSPFFHSYTLIFINFLRNVSLIFINILVLSFFFVCFAVAIIFAM